MNYFIDINDFRKVASKGVPGIQINYDGKINNVYFAKQKTGYGEKSFLKCPKCGSRTTKLYYHEGKFICRNCYPNNIYRMMQHSTKGGYEYIVYRMKQFAASKGIKIKKYPFHYLDYALEKPKYNHEEKWIENITILQAFENMRFQTYTFNKKWDTRTVNSIINNTNSLLYLYELYEIQEHIIKWDIGVNMNLNVSRETGVYSK